MPASAAATGTPRAHGKAQRQAHSNEPTADWLNHDVPGQKRLIEEELSRAEWAAPLRDAVRIDTVDSYQGSENALLILSLVRNNDKGLQGFLVDQSRINVALSRAKDRLVIIGSKRMEWRERTFRVGQRCSLCIRAARHFAR